MNEKGLKQGDRVQVTLVGSVHFIDNYGNVWIRSAGLAHDVALLPEVVEKLDEEAA